MKKLCIIPARGGSKRIPGKNSRLFFSRPIIEYPIQAAVSSGVFDKVVVYSDDAYIAFIAYAMGVSLIERKPVSDEETLAEALQGVNILDDYDVICCLLPTAVFADVKHLRDCAAVSEKVDSVCTVTYEGEKPEWSRDADGRLIFKTPMRDAGQFYFIKTEVFKKEQSLIAENFWPWEISAIDIDTEEDWKHAERRFGVGFLGR
jgi:pseudaminic acid cytidylyltransferase